MKIFILLASFFIGFQSLGAVVLDSPPDLLKKASLGRIELREVIMDLQLSASEFTTPQQFDPYFSILPDLAQISKDNALDEIFPDAVKKVGITMSANGMRWLDIVKDSPDRLKFYHQWMDEDVAFRFQSQVDYVLTAIKDLNQLKAAAVSIEKLIPELEILFPKNFVLVNTYRRLSSETALKIIRDQQLPEDEVIFWLSKVSMPSSFSDYFDFLRQEILSLEESNKEKSHFVMKRILVIGEQIEKNKQRCPGWIQDALGDLMLETLVKMQQLEILISKSEYQLLLKGMQPQHLKSLAQQFQSIEELPDLEFSKTYLEWLQMLALEMRSRNLLRDADNLVRYVNQISGPLMVKVFKAEGSYKLKDSKGQDWILSVVIAKDNMLVASLGMADGALYKSYFHGYYSFQEKKFITAFREADTDPAQNPVLKFSINANNQIEVEDLFARGPTNILVGSRFEEYPNYQEHRKEVLGDIDGIYSGVVYFPKKVESNLKLIVTSFSGYTLARFTDNKALDIEFNIGSRSGESPIYLTTGNLGSGTWIHVRLYKVSDRELRGYVIIGGRGKATKEFQLQKTN